MKPLMTVSILAAAAIASTAALAESTVVEQRMNLEDIRNGVHKTGTHAAGPAQSGKTHTGQVSATRTGTGDRVPFESAVSTQNNFVPSRPKRRVGE